VFCDAVSAGKQISDTIEMLRVPWQRRTFAMVKPDAVQHLGEVLAAAQAARLAVVNLRLARLTAAEAAEFYAVHRERPFFPKLLGALCCFTGAPACRPPVSCRRRKLFG